MPPLIERIDIRSVYEDVKVLAEVLNTTIDDVIAKGLAYWLTELTEDEAHILGAKAHLKYVGKKGNMKNEP